MLHGRTCRLDHLLSIAVGVPFGPRLCRSRFQLQSVDLLDVEHGVLFTDGIGTLLFFVDRVAVLVFQRLALLVLCGSCRPIREKQDLRPFLAFANLPARFFDLGVGTPTVVSPAIADTPAHQVEAVAARVGFAGREVLRADLLPRLPRLLPRCNSRLDLFDEFLADFLGVVFPALPKGFLRHAPPPFL